MPGYQGGSLTLSGTNIYVQAATTTSLPQDFNYDPPVLGCGHEPVQVLKARGQGARRGTPDVTNAERRQQVGKGPILRIVDRRYQVRRRDLAETLQAHKFPDVQAVAVGRVREETGHDELGGRAARRRQGRGVAANERITLAGLGIGPRGNYVLGCFMNEPVVQFVAIADIRKDHREAVKTLTEKHMAPAWRRIATSARCFRGRTSTRC